MVINTGNMAISKYRRTNGLAIRIINYPQLDDIHKHMALVPSRINHGGHEKHQEITPALHGG